MEKKDISSRTTVKAIITGFISYGVLITFLFLVLFALGNYFIKNLPGNNTESLYITLPLIAIILIFFVVRLVCKLSTYDVFKKCVTDPKNYPTITRNLEIFFVACIICSIVIFLGLLYLNLEFQIQTIDYSVLQYKTIFSEEHTRQLRSEMMDLYDASKANLIKSTVILEIGFTISFLSLIPYQRDMITKYNDYVEPKKSKKSKEIKKDNSESIDAENREEKTKKGSKSKSKKDKKE